MGCVPSRQKRRTNPATSSLEIPGERPVEAQTTRSADAYAQGSDRTVETLPSNRETAEVGLARTPPRPLGVSGYPTTAGAMSGVPAARVSETNLDNEDVVTSEAEAAAAPASTEEVECPVCLDTISVDDSAMRCAGGAGKEHYFHAGCLGEWSRTQEQHLAEPNCPICRGPIRVHRERLQAFLDHPAAGEKLDKQSRSFLTLLSKAGGQQSGWSAVITADKLRSFARAGGAFAGGLLHGVMGTELSEPENRDESRRETLALASTVGFALGTFLNVAGTMARDAARDAANGRRSTR